MKSQYERVPVNDTSDDLESSEAQSLKLSTGHQKVWRSRSHTAVLVLSFCFMLLLSTWIGYFYGSRAQQNSFALFEPDKETRSFSYNRTFSERPSLETDGAWETVFPPHGGFFHHRELAPNGASFAVYHQLHCLDAIRHAYWAVFDAMMAGQNISMTDLPDHWTDWHTRHCIDFLRQMLMCNADLTVEHNVPKIGGIVGFGINHQCKKWDQINAWVLDKQIAWENDAHDH